MNKIPGIIDTVVSEGQLSLVKINASGTIFTSIVIDTPETVHYLKLGETVDVIFKENEVAIAKQFSGMISMQNRFECTITGMETGKLLAKIVLNFNGHIIGSVITAQSAINMNLILGDRVTAMVKANEISISGHD